MRKENIGNWIGKEWIWDNHGNIMKSLYRYMKPMHSKIICFKINLQK